MKNIIIITEDGEQLISSTDDGSLTVGAKTLYDFRLMDTFLFSS